MAMNETQREYVKNQFQELFADPSIIEVALSCR